MRLARMQVDGVHCSRYTLIALLRSCTRLNDLERGREVHAEIMQTGFLRDLLVGNILINMYAKCGSVSEAREVFEKLPVRDVMSYTVLIAGYAEHGTDQEVWKCFKHMQLDGVSPNAFTVVCLLKACGRRGAIDKGREIHSEIARKGIEKDLFVGNILVDVYAKCGLISEAQGIFDKLPVRDVTTWTTVIAGYAEHGGGQEALKCFVQMQLEGIFPNGVTFVCVLKACGSRGAIGKGRQVHAVIVQSTFERDSFLGNTLVNMYSKCGFLSEAYRALEKLPVRDVVSWAGLIAGYAEHGTGKEALKCFELMQGEGVFPNSVTFVCILKACGSIGALSRGREIHIAIAQKGFESDVFVGSALVDIYAKCGSLPDARAVFYKLSVRDAVLWDALIAGYAAHAPGQEVLKCFEQMQLEGVSPNVVTYVRVLKACGSIGAMDKGREGHAEIARKGFDRELFVGNTLVDMYAKSGSLSEAQEVFDNLSARDVVSWTALMSGYAEHGPGEEALKCFEHMQLESISPSAAAFVSVLKACGGIGAIDKGRELHAEIMQKGFESNIFLSNTLIDMYAKCGSLSEAQEVFDGLRVPDVVSWAAIIAGYAEHGPGQEALKCFERMQLEGVFPSYIAFVYILRACVSIGAIGKGREIHAEIAQKGFERERFVGNVLIDMYAECGSISEAREVFDKLLVQDVVSWSAIIKAYGINHDANMAFQCFEEMQEQDVKPDITTFTCLFTACSHTNSVVKGQKYFKVMKEEYGIAPTTAHYMCMVDLLARSGHLYEAERFFKTMSCPPAEGMWRAVLSACKAYGEAEVGLRCFQQLVQMNPQAAASYVLMANIYGSAYRFDDASRIEELRKHAVAKKKPASASIEVNKEMHEFVIGNNKGENTSLFEILSLRMKGEGYVPNLDVVL